MQCRGSKDGEAFIILQRPAGRSLHLPLNAAQRARDAAAWAKRCVTGPGVKTYLQTRPSIENHSVWPSVPRTISPCDRPQVHRVAAPVGGADTRPWGLHSKVGLFDARSGGLRPLLSVNGSLCLSIMRTVEPARKFSTCSEKEPGTIGLMMSALPTYLVVRDSPAIDHARLEAQGVAPAQALTLLVQRMQVHRGLSVGMLGRRSLARAAPPRVMRSTPRWTT